MTESKDKHRRLMEILYEKTKDESLQWEDASWLGNYQTQIGNRYISIKVTPGEFDENDYEVFILDDSYNELDRFSDVDISEPELPPNVGNFRNYYLLMEALYRTVKRQISGADKALDEILEQLGKA